MSSKFRIPKVIHYCWFGRGPKPTIVLNCMETWKKFLPDYEIKEWNEDNFDINFNDYVKEAYEWKKFAFVSDYARLFALVNEGGVYMDTDVEVMKPLDNFLTFPAFGGFETEDRLSTAILASEKGGEWAKRMLTYYEGRHFCRIDGSLDILANTDVISELMKDGNFRLDNTEQDYQDIMHVFPMDYFSPKSYRTGKISLSSNTCTIHHFSGSWLPWNERMWTVIKFKYGFLMYCLVRPVLGPISFLRMLREVLSKGG